MSQDTHPLCKLTTTPACAHITFKSPPPWSWILVFASTCASPSWSSLSSLLLSSLSLQQKPTTRTLQAAPAAAATQTPSRAPLTVAFLPTRIALRALACLVVAPTALGNVPIDSVITNARQLDPCAGHPTASIRSNAAPTEPIFTPKTIVPLTTVPATTEPAIPSVSTIVATESLSPTFPAIAAIFTRVPRHQPRLHLLLPRLIRRHTRQLIPQHLPQLIPRHIPRHIRHRVPPMPRRMPLLMLPHRLPRPPPLLRTWSVIPLFSVNCASESWQL